MSKQSDLVSVSQGASGDPLYIDTTNDRVGIGTSSPSRTLEVDGSGNRVASFTHSAGTYSFATFSDTNTTDDGQVRIGALTNDLLAFAGGVERMRIDSSGNLLVAKTIASAAEVGMAIQENGVFKSTADGDRSGQFRRLTSDGTLIQLDKDATQIGAIGVKAGDNLSIGGTASSHAGITFGTNTVAPFNIGSYSNADNVYDLGNTSARWDDIYATNGTIQTSDVNEKQDIEALSDAEQRVAVAAKGLLRKYRWKDAVAEKGDAARIHFGIIAQDLQAAFEAEGLDAGRYGMFISNTWWEAEVEKTREVEQEDGTTVTETYTATETYDEPTEGAVERTRMGVRYPELLAFIIAAL